jgi:hypothetical protein
MDIIVHKCNVKLLDNIDASQTSVVSEALDIQSFSLYCAQFVFSSNFASVDGKIQVLVSNDKNAPFVAVDTHAAPNATGTSYSYLINVEKAGYAFVKLKYSCTSGVGTITGIVNGKVI